MNPIQRLLDETERVAGQIESASDEQLTALVELREEALRHLHASWAALPAQERERIRQILRQIGSHDEAIRDRMRAIRDEASLELQKIRQTRIQQEAYLRRGYKNDLFFDSYR